MSQRNTIAAVLLLSLGLNGCQGTSWGERLGTWVRGTGSATPSPFSTATGSPFPFTASPSPGASPGAVPPTPSTPILNPRLNPRLNRFTDLNDLTPLAQTAIQDLDQLAIWQGIEGNQFLPNRSVRRREFARWLVKANNTLSQTASSRQIRLGRGGDRPIFLDVPEDDPDFLFIQALGQAGLVSGDSHQEFRPESLLSRADLIRMKAPLDVPPGSIQGSLEQLQQQWGFSDSNQIPADAIAALVADRTLGDASTILRTFGPIQIFHPLDPVNRADVAIALAQFHHPTRTAADLIETLTATPTPALPTPTPSPSPLPNPSGKPLEGNSSTPAAGPSLIPTNPANVAPGQFVTPTSP